MGDDEEKASHGLCEQDQRHRDVATSAGSERRKRRRSMALPSSKGHRRAPDPGPPTPPGHREARSPGKGCLVRARSQVLRCPPPTPSAENGAQCTLLREETDGEEEERGLRFGPRRLNRPVLNAAPPPPQLHTQQRGPLHSGARSGSTSRLVVHYHTEETREQKDTPARSQDRRDLNRRLQSRQAHEKAHHASKPQ